MRNTVQIIGVSLASIAGILLVTGVASAQAGKTPVSGYLLSGQLTDPGEYWWDEEGIFQERNVKRRLRYSGDIDGLRFAVLNAKVDPVTGEQVINGFFSFVGEVLGDLITATGRIKTRCSPIEGVLICESDVVWHLSDGGVMKTSRIWEPPSFPHEYVGVINDNPGGN
jgi:hypothetical protein